ncbi:MAG: type II secretion system minor pseudopilin [Planctomycetota bacterium]|jgi:type II secretory pathway component PulK
MRITLEKFGNYRHGSVLILVLIVISAMTIVAFGLAYQTRIEMRLSKSSSQQAILRSLALSGLDVAKVILSEKERTCDQTARICRFYQVKDNLKLFEQLKLPPDEEVQIVFWIKDESSLLDLNKSNSTIWENLPAFTRDKRACILDWIDTDSDTNPDGAETDYYERLEPSYICKNASIICLKELLLIKNISHSDYLGNIFKEKIVNPDDMELLLYKDSTQSLSFIDTFTTFGQETVNINTVSGAILSVLAGLDQQVADIVVAFRSGPDGVENTDDDRVFEKAEDILQIEGLTELQKELLSQYSCFNSDMFRVFSYVKVNQQVCFLMATVRAAGNKSEIICVERLL